MQSNLTEDEYNVYNEDFKRKINELNDEMLIIANTNPLNLCDLKAKVKQIQELYQKKNYKR